VGGSAPAPRAAAEEERAGHERVPATVARRVRLVVLDVDGVLTDAGVYVGATAEGTPVELKRFDIQDGLGIRFLKAAGIQVALLSGRTSPATSLRGAELGIEECIQVPGANKLPALRELLERLEIDWDEVAMLGDDIPDLPVLRRVGLPAAVGNATPEVRREVTFTTRREGGRGAVREFARVLLEARGEWNHQVERYCAERSHDR
jgi:3-deoxy-D-manno-octulosonate 8-phosphate phosphatase (KDO 8-P phosphatase)